MDIPLPEIIRQIRLQWRLDDTRAGAALDRALAALGITARKKLFGGRVVSGEEYRLLLDWLNRNGPGGG